MKTWIICVGPRVFWGRLPPPIPDIQKSCTPLGVDEGVPKLRSKILPWEKTADKGSTISKVQRAWPGKRWDSSTLWWWWKEATLWPNQPGVLDVLWKMTECACCVCVCALPMCAGALKGGEPRGNLTSREWDHLPLKKPASFSGPTNQAQHAGSAQGRCSTATPYGHKTQQPERPRHSLLFPANICKS